MDWGAAAADQRGQEDPQQAVLLRRTVPHTHTTASCPVTAAVHACLCLSISCDSKAFKRLMSNFGSLRSEESCSAVVELLERVTRLQKELELKESQDDLDVEQVEVMAPGWAGQLGSICSWKLFSLDNLFFTLRPFCGCQLFVEVAMKVEASEGKPHPVA